VTLLRADQRSGRFAARGSENHSAGADGTFAFASVAPGITPPGLRSTVLWTSTEIGRRRAHRGSQLDAPAELDLGTRARRRIGALHRSTSRRSRSRRSHCSRRPTSRSLSPAIVERDGRLRSAASRRDGAV
jgi:hypothetical protein